MWERFDRVRWERGKREREIKDFCSESENALRRFPYVYGKLVKEHRDFSKMCVGAPREGALIELLKMCIGMLL